MFSEKRSIKTLFTKQKDPKELVRKWQGSIRSEVRKVERQIRDIQREEKKAKASVKDAAKRGDMNSAKILARELVHTKKTITQLHTNKAHMVSMQTSLSEQLAVAKVAGTLNKSADVMKSINTLLKIPDLMRTVQELSREMTKAGLIEEMVEDVMDDVGDTEDLEEETEAEVDKILMEITGDTLAELPQASRPQASRPAQQQQEEEEEEDEDLEGLQQRLNTIRN
ncbi:hypothetical protein BSKO_09200 [Bryopsis sp. KO-2023]|nr:hypothetical protein BSKO_09200 [Bryopsis sp. KO-2023]